MWVIWFLMYLMALQQPQPVSTDPDHLIALQGSMDSMQMAYVNTQRKFKRFNPNYLTDYEAYLCGFSPTELREIRRYREGGGMLHSASELGKLLKWAPGLSEVRKERFYFPVKRKSKDRDLTRPKVDLNTASTRQLQELSGIGPVLSGRIVRFRERLSGFRDVRQLRDVYGMREEVADRLLAGYLFCSPPADSSRIPLATAPPSVLRGFPYFSERQVDRILHYRASRNGRIEADDIRVLFDLSDEKFNRIKLYLQ